MIVEFSVENYLSFKEMQTLSMLATPMGSKFANVDTQNKLDTGLGFELLKSKAIYGANASGKSNISGAFVCFISIVNRSVIDEKILAENIDVFRLSTETEKKPSYFQMIFILDNVQYRYGFEATPTTIISEWLFGKPNKKEVPFFTRENIDIKVNDSFFSEASSFVDLFQESGNEVARVNALFLTAVKTLRGGLAKKIVDYISSINVIPGLSSDRFHSIAGQFLDKPEMKTKIQNFLKMADTGIESIERVEIPEGALSEQKKKLSQKDKSQKKQALILTGHKKYNASKKVVSTIPFSMIFHESEGTKKMFEISPFVINAINDKTVVILDEFDARFHPRLTSQLVQLFNSEANQGAQFVFMTHDTNLLDPKLLRRDQIEFVEKDKYGISSIYSLADFKGVRNDAVFEKEYLLGKYGAVPFLKDFDSIF